MKTIDIDNILKSSAKYITRYIAGVLAGGVVFCLASCVSLSGASCACFPSGLLPANGTCVAYGGTLTLTDGKINPSIGCVETKPYPGMKGPSDPVAR
jgi:hypothetical protein